MTLPNLVGCGAGKSGTTSLYYYLSQHPEIFMVAMKEVHYFSRFYDRGKTWYESHFTAAGGAKIVGEFSTTYMLDPAVPSRMGSLLPQAKLLFIFRNPIERAYSNYWFSLSIGSQATDQAFSEAIRTEEGHDKYVASGFYYQHLERFLDYFDHDQIYVMLTEELKREPPRQMALCYEFLGVDSAFQPDVKSRYNVTLTTSNGFVASAYKSWMMTKKRVKPFIRRFPLGLRHRLAVLEKRVLGQALSGERPEMSHEDREYLRAIYKPENERLAEHMGRDLTLWNHKSARA